MKPLDEFSTYGLSATDSEEQIIAAMLDGCTDHLALMLRILPDAAAFADDDRRRMWSLVQRMHQDGEAISLATLKAALRRDESITDIDSLIYPRNSTHTLHSAKLAEHHARQIAYTYARRLNGETSRLMESADAKPEELAGALRERLQRIEAIAVSTGQNLPEPVPMVPKLAPVMDFNPEWLPDSLKNWIADIAHRMQCPSDFAAAASMCALSSVAGRRFCIQPKEHDASWTEHPHLWAMIIGKPSLMKSPSMRAVMRPLRALENEAFLAYESMERERMAADIEAKIKRGNLEKQARKACEKSEAFDFTQLIEEEGEASHCRRYIVNDASIEALGEVLRSNPTGTLLYQDELAGLLAMLQKDGNQSLRTFLLQAWSGMEGFTFDRIGRGTRRVEHCAVSIMGSIQPGVIASHVRAANDNGCGADGFLQRFSLMVWPEVKAEWSYVDRPLNSQAEEQAVGIFQAMESFTQAHFIKANVPLGRDDVPTFRFAPDAQQRFQVWLDSHENRLRTEGMTAAFESHLAKYRKLVPALAVLIHVAEWQTGPVSLNALDRALSWAVYLETHAARVYGSGSTADCQGAVTLLKKLRDGSNSLLEPFTAREVYRKGWSGITRPDTAEAACELLTGNHWLLATSQSSTDRGGRPTFLYRLNPRAAK